MHKITIILVLLYGVSPVETQNLASHEEVCARRDRHDALMLGVFVACETQDFASLLLGTSDMAMGEIYLACGGAAGSGIHVSKNKKRGTEALFWASVDIYRFFF